jgi:hypothetical protein
LAAILCLVGWRSSDSTSPQNRAYTEHLVRCGQDLTEHGCYGLDQDWLPNVKLLHIAEEIQELTRTSAKAAMSHTHLRGVKQQLQHWQYQSLTGTRDNTRLSLAFHFVRIHLYEKALLKDRLSHFELVGAAGETLTPALGAHTLFFLGFARHPCLPRWYSYQARFATSEHEHSGVDASHYRGDYLGQAGPTRARSES